MFQSRETFKYLISAAVVLIAFSMRASAEDALDCFYKDNRGVIKVSDSLEKIPVEYRKSAQCSAARKGDMVRPNQIQLEGNARSINMASPLGRIELRWPRALEKVFGRTPERALADAAKTASKALKSGGFPPEVANINLSLRIILLDQNLPERQIPMQLVSDCHPGWMYPPGDIFIVGQIVARGCGGDEKETNSDADRALARVLLHEIGHAIEFAILKDHNPSDPFRAEGFASWFEGFSSQYSNILDSREVPRTYAAYAVAGLNQGLLGKSFSGSPYDYGLGYLEMQYFVERRGVAGLMHLYADQISNGALFAVVFRKMMGLSDAKLREALAKLANEIQ